MELDSHVFYDQTTSLCENENCLKLIQAKIVFETALYIISNIVQHTDIRKH